MAKRKATTQPSARSKKKRATTSGHRQSQLPFRFLDLPAELRTQVLALYARDVGTALLNRTSRGQVSTGDAIGRANKQVREEYIGVLYEHARTTLAHVRNFDFRHVVTYFNKLNKAEVEALPVKAAEPEQARMHKKSYFLGPGGNFFSSVLVRKSVPKPSAVTSASTSERRTVKIILDFTPNASWTTGFLTRWLNRQNATHKVGATTDFKYEVLSKEATWEWRGRRDWVHMATGLSWPGEQQAEVDKMVDAIQEAVKDREEKEMKERLERLRASTGARAWVRCR